MKGLITGNNDLEKTERIIAVLQHILFTKVDGHILRRTLSMASYIE